VGVASLCPSDKISVESQEKSPQDGDVQSWVELLGC
jgi:hypothetical protein